MDIALSFIFSTLSSGLADRLGNFIDKKHVAKLMEKLRETTELATVASHQNELYYNDLDRYITQNSIVDKIIRICYNKNDPDFLTIESFSALHCDKFTASHTNHLGQRAVIKIVFSRLYAAIDTAINNCNFTEETRIITNKIESTKEELRQELRSGLQQLSEEIKRTSKASLVTNETMESKTTPNSAILALAQENVTLQNIVHELSTTTGDLLDQRYNAVIDTALNGSWSEAKKILEDTIEKFYESKGKSHAKLLYLASLWALPRDKDVAASYYESSLQCDPEQDTRLYHTSLFELNGDYSAAIDSLGEINSTVVFNQYLMLMFNSRTPIDIDSTTKEYEHLNFNEGSYHAILLHSLRCSDFDKAVECAEKLMQLRERSALYAHLAGMVYYWKTIARNTPHEPGVLFAVPMSSERNFSISEIADASKAAECFQKAYELAKISSDEDMFINTLMGVLSANWILCKSELAEEKAKELWQTDKGNPIAALYLLEYDHNGDVCISDLEKRAGEDPYAITVYIKWLVKLGEYETAVIALNKYEEQIKGISIFEWVDIYIWVLIKRKDISKAYSVIERNRDDLQDDDYMRSILYVMQFDETKTISDVVGQATRVKDQHGQSMDYKNLCNIYRRFGKWSKVARTAKQWLKKHQTTEALPYIAEAQFNQQKTLECLENLAKVESEYGLTVSLKALRLNCLSQLSRFDEALELVNEIGINGYADEALTIHKAKLEFNSGSFNEAARTLRMYIDSNDDAIEAVLFLSKLLAVDSPKEAYNELKKLHEKHPERTDIALNTMHQGFAAGYDSEASQIMWKFVHSRPNKKHFKALKSDELIPFFENAVKTNEPFNKMHIDGLLPNHIMFDKLNGSMGFYVYSKWMLSSNAYMLWSYGGRTESNLCDVIEGKKLILDYSAILSIECLGLFNIVEQLFDKLYVSPRLFLSMHQEIGRLKNVQESVKKRNEILHRHFQNRKQNITIVDDCVEHDETISAEQQDKILYHTAKAHDAYIVTDSFAGEVLYGEEIPTELRSDQIYESELLALLMEKELFPSQPHGNIQPRPEKIDELHKSDRPFLVNSNVLGELAEKVDISSLASVIPLIVLKSDVERLANFNQAVSEQDDGVQWLKTLLDKLISYRNKGFLEFCPNADQKNSVGDRTEALLDCVSYSCNTGTPLWIDDRWANGMFSSGKAAMFGIYDFVHTLFNIDIINEFEHQRILGELIRNNVFFHVPPKDYVFRLLKTASHDVNGNLKETAPLTELRRYVANALSTQSCIGKEPRTDIKAIPEIYGFILLLNRLYCDLLECVWSETGKGTSWKVAAGDWVWQYLSDFACDIDMPDRIDIDNDIASKHMSLLTCLFRISSEHQQICSEWVFFKLYSYWLFHPSNKQKTADCVATAIFGESSFEKTPLEKERFEEIMLVMCQRLFPPDFMTLVLDNPLCKSKWGDRYEMVQFEVEQEHVEYPIPISDDSVKYDSDCDFISLLSSNPTDWTDILQAVIYYGVDDVIDAIINFFNAYLEKYDADTIERACMKAVEHLMLHSPVEYRVKLRELLRKF